MRIRSILEAAFSATCVLALAGSAQAMPSQLGYSGRLYDARANAITGSADFKVTLYSGGSAVGAAQEFSDTQVVDGSFTVLLDATDELVAILSDPAADTVVLSFEVRMHGGSSYELLVPPQPLVPTAWALAGPPEVDGSVTNELITAATWTPATNTLTVTEAGTEHAVAVSAFNAPLAVAALNATTLNVSPTTDGSNVAHECAWYGAWTTTEAYVVRKCPQGTHALSGMCHTDGGAALTDSYAWHQVEPCVPGGAYGDCSTYPPVDEHFWHAISEHDIMPATAGLGWFCGWNSAPCTPPPTTCPSTQHSVAVLCCKY